MSPSQYIICKNFTECRGAIPYKFFHKIEITPGTDVSLHIFSGPGGYFCSFLLSNIFCYPLFLQNGFSSFFRFIGHLLFSFFLFIYIFNAWCFFMKNFFGLFNFQKICFDIWFLYFLSSALKSSSDYLYIGITFPFLWL